MFVETKQDLLDTPSARDRDNSNASLIVANGNKIKTSSPSLHSLFSLISSSSSSTKLNLLKPSAANADKANPILVDFTKMTSNCNHHLSSQHQQQPPNSQQSLSSSKLNIQQQITNGLFIRKEIQRFESVHPNIYSIYDLIDSIGDFNLQQQIREHIVNIEDSFVNSQEWTLSRNVADLKLGIVGSVNSGKSSLVHRFLTGTYIQEESPEGGRFKKEVVIDGQSYLLLIRDEGGVPEMQFAHWVDAVIFVFSLENEESFLTVHQYYTKMANYRSMNDIPFILVGTQDLITETNPRVIDDLRARNLACELKKCTYYETCASYGLHVERVFQDACQKVINLRAQLLLSFSNSLQNTTALTPQHSQISHPPQQLPHSTSSSIRLLAGSHINAGSANQQHNQQQSQFPGQPPSAITTSIAAVLQASTLAFNGTAISTSPQSCTNGTQPFAATPQTHSLNYFLANPHLFNSASQHATNLLANQPNNSNCTNTVNGQTSKSPILANNNCNNLFKEPLSVQSINNSNTNGGVHFQPLTDKKSSAFLQPDSNNLPITPSSTPNQKRKDRRRSNLFTPNKKEDKQNKINDMGVGRSIPVKQGFLYKKTNSTINKDWKKKFVTLNDNGSLRYYPSMNDYMDEVHGKEIDLQKTTIKIPGTNKPRIGKSLLNLDANKLNSELNSLNLNTNMLASNCPSSTALTELKTVFSDDLTNSSTNSHSTFSNGTSHNEANYLAKFDVNSSKKRHRRIKSNHKSDQSKEDEQEGFEFIIVSLDNKQWHFEASSNDEREEWVQAIEQQILSSLQLNETNKLKAKHGGVSADNVTILTMKNVPGNSTCADCDAKNPVWASLNHGELICIECSGIHRNLGTHLSRVRSLELDDWSNELVQVMTSIGNHMINSIYEANTKSYHKPNANSVREEKEKWIRAKYESKLFLASLPNKDVQVGKQLIEAVGRQDIAGVILCLAHSKPEDVNCCVSAVDKRTSLHIAASMPNLVIVQLLIWYGADVDCVDNGGKTALVYAKNANSSECIQLLVHNGCTDRSPNSMARCSNSTSQIISSNTFQFNAV